MSTCDVKNCGREIGTLGNFPAIHYGNMLVCDACHLKLEEVRAELPMAIMEFHAWALMHPGGGNGNHSEELRQAAERVTSLRKLQEWLKT